MTIQDLKRIRQHEAINFKGICDGIGLNYNTIWAKINNDRPLTQSESTRIEQYMMENGIHWEQLINN